MEIKACRSCRRLYQHITGPSLCQECKNDLEKKFDTVRIYIRDNPNTPIGKVSEENDVSLQQIQQWIREERILLSEGSPDILGCEHCGAPIQTGRLCLGCKAKLHDSLDGAIERPKARPLPSGKKSGEKIRFLKP